MKKYVGYKLGFTLIEVLVSITIFSLIMISVIAIYITSTDISLKSDINRQMQENIKNVVETIAEDVRKQGIVRAVSSEPDFCHTPVVLGYHSGNKLCVGSIVGSNFEGNRYYLANSEGNRTSPENCDEIGEHCMVAKNGFPLTNSSVSVKKMDFSVSKTDKSIPKVTMNITIQPATGRGVKSNLIQESKLIFQTTISERPLNQ